MRYVGPGRCRRGRVQRIPVADPQPNGPRIGRPQPRAIGAGPAWVARSLGGPSDPTDVSTRTRWVDVHFVVDANVRPIVSWRTGPR